MDVPEKVQQFSPNFIALLKYTNMEFGKIPAHELDQVDFSLPAEPEINRQVLKGSRATNPGVYIGCTRWSVAEWKGIIYPEKLKEKDFLQHYTGQFNCIELNATHYKVYGEQTIRQWAAMAQGREFKFCPKMFKGVTHSGSLAGKEMVTGEFLRGLTAFGPHLGPVFIQLSDFFSPGRKEELFSYLHTLPAGFRFFLELRHPGWFAAGPVREALFEKLRELQMGAVLTDSAGRRDCVHMQLPVPGAFIRYVGNGMHPTDYARADRWAERICSWLESGLEEVYFMLHMQDETTSPAMAAYLADQLNKTGGLNLAKPVFMEQAKTQAAAITNGRLFD